MEPSLASSKALLDMTNLIRRHAEQLDYMTGGQFNIFDVMRLTSHENSHSLFLAELLNPKGSHGQGEIFWNAFIEVLGEQGVADEKENQVELAQILAKLSPKDINVVTELYLGAKTENTGGRIDIAILCDGLGLLIENKIFAQLQERQLQRYLSTNKPVLFLTLYDSDFASEGLPFDANLFRISYQNHITAWLEKCISLAAEKAALRESIIQYRTLVRGLTNQGRNRIMNQELKTLICRDADSIRSFFALKECENDIYEEVAVKFLAVGCHIAKETNLQLFETSFNYAGLWEGLSFRKEQWSKYNLQIGVQFHRYYKNLSYGICYLGEDKDYSKDGRVEELNRRFAEIFGQTEAATSWWPASAYFDSNIRHWDAEVFSDILISNPESGKIGKSGEIIMGKVAQMKGLLNEVLGSA